jgi:hypothetical protein
MSNYKIVNLIFTLLFILLIGYSFFYNSIPNFFHVKSVCAGNILCKSEGLTRAFNAALHGNYLDAIKFNLFYKNALYFILIQILLRLITTLLSSSILKKYKVIPVDIALSSLAFVFSFYNFLPIELIIN